MSVRIITVPDGMGGYNEVYSAPSSTKDANAWLQRVGACHLKFGTSKGKAVLKDANTGKVYLSSERVADICYSLAFNPLHMKKYGIPYYDWYRPDSVWNTMKPVTIHL